LELRTEVFERILKTEASIVDLQKADVDIYSKISELKVIYDTI
jgi:hypothetical protein